MYKKINNRKNVQPCSTNKWNERARGRRVQRGSISLAVDRRERCAVDARRSFARTLGQTARHGTAPRPTNGTGLRRPYLRDRVFVSFSLFS